MTTICLVMIVKNEMKVLERCFDSVVKYLDYWVICDTGSTDGTQKFIKEYFKSKKLPGTLLEHKWIDFGYNRTKAVRAAHKKADYLILMDADFVFCIKDSKFKKTKLKMDSYQIKYEGALDYRQALFVSGKKKWKYVGVTHEYITCDPPNRTGMLDAFTFDHLADGGNRSDKFERDIRLLTKGLKDEPNNIRYMFYLAQSHKDLSHWDEAIKYYIMRAKKGGWDEEVYYSLYQLGVCMMNRGDPYDKFKGYLLKAHKHRPSRLEALYRLVDYCRLNNKFEEGYQYGKVAINNKYPHGDLLFIEKDIHEWMFQNVVALCAFYINKPFESLKIYKRLIDSDKIPDGQKKYINDNYKFFKEAYERQIRSGSNDSNITEHGGDGDIEIHSSYQNQVTVILNVYKRISIFEAQLNSILNQSVKPYEIWVCIFDSPHESEFISIINKYNHNNNIKTIISDINFKYYGRYQLGIQAKTPYVCYYDDDRFPNKDNLKFYLTLIDKEMFKYSILGQWGWILHKPEYINGEMIGEWEYSPHYKNSRWVQYDPSNTNKAIEVDYLCGHWFTHKYNLYYLYREMSIDFSTGEDIRLSFMAYKYDKIKSYCCIPDSDTEIIGHNEGDIKGSTDGNSLILRSSMIKEYITDGYKLVLDRSVDEVGLNKNVKRLCFFCYDYTSIGGSELTIKNLYDNIHHKLNGKIDVIITTDFNEMITFKPDIVITQQMAIKVALDNSEKYGYDVYILLHGPGQFRNYHPRCKLLIYNSDSLLLQETEYVDSRIDKMVLHPSVNMNTVKTSSNILPHDRKYISFIGSNSYNIIKGSDLFVGLAKSFPDKDFLHVSNYKPVDYSKDTYFGLRVGQIVPTEYCNLDIKTISNLKIINQTNDIASIYEDTKILIVPSLIESFGRVAVEAAINNIPVICSDLPGLRESTFNLAYYVKEYRDVNAFRNGVVEVEKNYEYYQEQTKKIVELYYEKQVESLNKINFLRAPTSPKPSNSSNSMSIGLRVNMEQLFREDLDTLLDMIERGVNFAFTRYGAGEYYLVQGSKIGPGHDMWDSDGWGFNGDKESPIYRYIHRSLEHTEPTFYYGIHDRCCFLKSKMFILDLLKCTMNQITFANLFVNGNYPYSKDRLKRILKDRPLLLFANDSCEWDKIGQIFNIVDHRGFSGSVVEEFNKNHETILSDMRGLASKYNNTIFLFAVGPLSEILIDEAYRTNPNNIYLDIGSIFDEEIRNKRTRAYHKEGVMKRMCVF